MGWLEEIGLIIFIFWMRCPSVTLSLAHSTFPFFFIFYILNFTMDGRDNLWERESALLRTLPIAPRVTPVRGKGNPLHEWHRPLDESIGDEFVEYVSLVPLFVSLTLFFLWRNDTIFTFFFFFFFQRDSALAAIVLYSIDVTRSVLALAFSCLQNESIYLVWIFFCTLVESHFLVFVGFFFSPTPIMLNSSPQSHVDQRHGGHHGLPLRHEEYRRRGKGKERDDRSHAGSSSTKDHSRQGRRRASTAGYVCFFLIYTYTHSHFSLIFS